MGDHRLTSTDRGTTSFRRGNPTIRRLLAAGLMTGLVTGAATPARAVPPFKRFREFALPTANSNPIRITAGPDGNLWFTES